MLLEIFIVDFVIVWVNWTVARRLRLWSHVYY